MICDQCSNRGVYEDGAGRVVRCTCIMGQSAPDARSSPVVAEKIARIDAMLESSATPVILVARNQGLEFCAIWRALTAERRLELMAMCCQGCGSLDPSCRCWDDN